MVCERVFKLSTDELLKLATLQISAIHNLPYGEFSVDLIISTDGILAELTSATITFCVIEATP